jgi:hypothetical protein
VASVVVYVRAVVQRVTLRAWNRTVLRKIREPQVWVVFPGFSMGTKL